MAKQDIIPVYTIGINRPKSGSGIYMITHNLDEALDILSSVSRGRANPSTDPRFYDPWLVEEQMFIEKSELEVDKYLNVYCENMSEKKARALAESHGFALEEVWYWLK